MEHTAPIKEVIPDSRGRILLGELAEGVSKFVILRDTDTDNLILEPYVDIPKKEAWLFKNKEALASVRQGLKESSDNDVEILDLDNLT